MATSALLSSPSQPANWYSGQTMAFAPLRISEPTILQADPVSDKHEFARVRIHTSSALTLQPKLFIGASGDRFEREADAVADQVLRRTEDDPLPGGPQADPVQLSREGPGDCARREMIRRDPTSPFSTNGGMFVEEDEQLADDSTTVQAKPMSPGRAMRDVDGVSVGIQSLRSQGSPLPGAVRSFMEPRFGHDFGRVRIHTDSQATSLARVINARAFAIGRDIVFGQGQFAPESNAGKWLIAHELAHVVQQGQTAPAFASRSAAGRPLSLARDPQTHAIRRVRWNPNIDTSERSAPWGPKHPAGRVLRAATDGGTALNIWRPDDNITYWCHGFTFGGSIAKGGPYSIWGEFVPSVLTDDGWRPTQSCMASNADIIVFRDASGNVTHSGIVRNVVSNAGMVDEAKSTVESKWGSGSHNTKSWAENATNYGQYLCYSKAPQQGACARGVHES